MLGFNKKQQAQPVGQTKILATNLYDEKAKSDIILNAIDDGVILIDANKTIQLFNPAAEKITGLSVREVLRLFTERFLTGKIPEELKDFSV